MTKNSLGQYFFIVTYLFEQLLIYIGDWMNLGLFYLYIFNFVIRGKERIHILYFLVLRLFI